jgi:hypothetical protein
MLRRPASLAAPEGLRVRQVHTCQWAVAQAHDKGAPRPSPFSGSCWGRTSGLPLFRRTLIPTELRNRCSPAWIRTKTTRAKTSRAASYPTGERPLIRDRDSNSDSTLQRRMSCRWTIPECLAQRLSHRAPGQNRTVSPSLPRTRAHHYHYRGVVPWGSAHKECRGWVSNPHHLRDTARRPPCAPHVSPGVQGGKGDAPRSYLEPRVGLEPTTSWLRIRCTSTCACAARNGAACQIRTDDRPLTRRML